MKTLKQLAQEARTVKQAEQPYNKPHTHDIKIGYKREGLDPELEKKRDLKVSRGLLYFYFCNKEGCNYRSCFELDRTK